MAPCTCSASRARSSHLLLSGPNPTCAFCEMSTAPARSWCSSRALLPCVTRPPAAHRLQAAPWVPVPWLDPKPVRHHLHGAGGCITQSPARPQRRASGPRGSKVHGSVAPLRAASPAATRGSSELSDGLRAAAWKLLPVPGTGRGCCGGTQRSGGDGRAWACAAHWVRPGSSAQVRGEGHCLVSPVSDGASTGWGGPTPGRFRESSSEPETSGQAARWEGRPRSSLGLGPKRADHPHPYGVGSLSHLRSGKARLSPPWGGASPCHKAPSSGLA